MPPSLLPNRGDMPRVTALAARGDVGVAAITGATRSRVGSHVAHLDRLLQTRQRVAGGDELLPDVAGVADLHQRLHDRRVVDLLRLVQLPAAGVAGGVDV